MQVMTDMELDDEDQLDCPMPVGCERPKYPYGLRICLTEKELAKLNLDPAAACVGGIVHLHALAKITSVSSNEMENADGEASENCRVEMQITAMMVESEDEENEMADDENAERGSVLYGS